LIVAVRANFRQQALIRHAEISTNADPSEDKGLIRSRRIPGNHRVRNGRAGYAELIRKDPHCLGGSSGRKSQQKVLGDSLPAGRLPTEIPRLRIQNEVVRKRRGHKLSRRQHPDSVNHLRPAATLKVWILMTMP
jgi:hypothetical protein